MIKAFKTNLYLHWILIAIATSLSGCSSVATLSKEPIKEPTKAPTKTDATDTKDDMQKLLSDLTERVRSLDSRLGNLTEKLDSLTKKQETQLSPIITHPSEYSGKPVNHLASINDPLAGFVNNEAVQIFRNSLLLFQAQKYSEAILEFSHFLERYADHPLAGSAQFYIGDSYLKQKQYKLALEELQRVLDSYSTSIHITDTLRDMILAEEALKLTDDAAKHRHLLTSLFPQSPAAEIPMQPQQDTRVTPAPVEASSDSIPPPLTAPLEGQTGSDR